MIAITGTVVVFAINIQKYFNFILFCSDLNCNDIKYNK